MFGRKEYVIVKHMASFEGVYSFLTIGNLFHRDQEIRDNAANIEEASRHLGLTVARQKTTQRIAERRMPVWKDHPKTISRDGNKQHTPH